MTNFAPATHYMVLYTYNDMVKMAGVRDVLTSGARWGGNTQL